MSTPRTRDRSGRDSLPPGLPAMQGRLEEMFGLLYARLDRWTPAGLLLSQMYGGYASGNAVRMIITRLRVALRGTEWEVQTYPHNRGLYRLVRRQEADA